MNRLTDREREVLELVVEGHQNKEIAAVLNISLKTVTAHLTSIFASLGVRSRTQAAMWASGSLREQVGMHPDGPAALAATNSLVEQLVNEVARLRGALTERGMTESWRPEWTSPPGDTLRELIEMRGWTQAHLAREIGWSLKHVNRVVQGHETISVDFAMALESLDFASAEFWMRREGDYRVGVARAALAGGAAVTRSQYDSQRTLARGGNDDS